MHSPVLRFITFPALCLPLTTPKPAGPCLTCDLTSGPRLNVSHTRTRHTQLRGREPSRRELGTRVRTQTSATGRRRWHANERITRGAHVTASPPPSCICRCTSKKRATCTCVYHCTYVGYINHYMRITYLPYLTESERATCMCVYHYLYVRYVHIIIHM